VFYLFSRMGNWLVKNTDAIETKFGRNKVEALTEVELQNTASEEERNILKGIEKFGNVTVKQIMRTRLDVSAINEKTSFADLLKSLDELHYSRVPIYKDDLDQVVGMIQTKDVLPYIDEAGDYDWRGLMRTPYFVHEHKMIEDLLREFQSKRIHFAVVVDEFGGTSGIVTLEDIMEEIIGDIKDEFDEDDSSFKKLDDKNYVFEGKAMIHDVCKAMKIPESTFDKVKGESDSLAGLVLEVAGEIPKPLQVLVSGDFKFTVLEIEKNRLQKIKVTIE
jgi:putative hemolysin